MGMILIVLGAIFVLVAIICQIMVLVKLFQTEGAGKGILGLICNLYLLIWGFMNASRLNLMKLLIGWIVFALIGGALIGAGSAMSASEMSTYTTP
jgi:hypothetical protein